MVQLISVTTAIVGGVTYPFRKIGSYAQGINDYLQAPTVIGNAAKDGLEYTSRLAGATTGSAGLAKGSVDALEALACQDGICFTISCIGCSADALGIAASFVPGPNVTLIVTAPISVGCKTFVWACKRAKLPWGGC